MTLRNRLAHVHNPFLIHLIAPCFPYPCPKISIKNTAHREEQFPSQSPTLTPVRALATVRRTRSGSYIYDDYDNAFDARVDNNYPRRIDDDDDYEGDRRDDDLHGDRGEGSGIPRPPPPPPRDYVPIPIPQPLRPRSPIRSRR